MKMKKNTIFLLSIILCHNLIAQSISPEEYQYVPIPDKHIWSVSTQKFATYGDTLINNKEYLKVYYQDKLTPFDFDISQAKYYCALRNDTLNKRVYVVYPRSYPVYDYEGYWDWWYPNILFFTTDTTELLLYDFSLNLGDTVSIYELSDSKLFKIPMKRVEEIWLYVFPDSAIFYSDTDSMQMLANGDFRKRILMRVNYPGWENEELPSRSTAWVEGIGSIHGLTRHFMRTLVGSHEQPSNLLCYAHENILLLRTPWNINNNCHRLITSNINENNRNRITLYPNPTSEELRISPAGGEQRGWNNYELREGKIEIFDVYGKRVLSQKYEERIDVSPLKAGYYILKITTSNVDVHTGRFVKF